MELCKGYAVTEMNADRTAIVEILYAVLADGRVLESEARSLSWEFVAGRTWRVSEKTPAWVRGNVAFVGDYPVPVMG